MSTEQGHTPKKFQHTATRRWLIAGLGDVVALKAVSTHSHPKVAD
ncbi:hypothetical protein [Neisseria arctica]